MIRTVIVDGSTLMREILRGALEEEDTIRVVGTASGLHEAGAVIRGTDPDVVTVDVEVPGMDCLGILDQWVRCRPVPVVLVASSTRNAAENTLRAVELGAVGSVVRPVGRGGWNRFATAIRRKVLDAAGARPDGHHRRTPCRVATMIPAPGDRVGRRV